MNGKRRCIRLSRFGCVSALLFEDGGAAEVLLDGLELKRILEAWEQHEMSRDTQNDRIVSALRLLASKARDLNLRLVAEVPIAQRRAKITPVTNQLEVQECANKD